MRVVPAIRPRLSAFLCLRWSILVALAFLWNALWLLGLWLNGWSRHISSKASLAIVVFSLLGLAAFSLLLAYSPAFAASVIEPSRAERFHRPSFLFIGFFTAFMALFFLAQ